MPDRKTIIEVIEDRLKEPEGFWLQIDRGKGWARYDLYGVGEDFLDLSRTHNDGTQGDRFLLPLREVRKLRICE